MRTQLSTWSRHPAPSRPETASIAAPLFHRSGEPHPTGISPARPDDLPDSLVGRGEAHGSAIQPMRQAGSAQGNRFGHDLASVRVRPAGASAARGRVIQRQESDDEEEEDETMETTSADQDEHDDPPPLLPPIETSLRGMETYEHLVATGMMAQQRAAAEAHSRGFGYERTVGAVVDPDVPVTISSARHDGERGVYGASLPEIGRMAEALGHHFHGGTTSSGQAVDERWGKYHAEPKMLHQQRTTFPPGDSRAGLPTGVSNRLCSLNHAQGNCQELFQADADQSGTIRSIADPAEQHFFLPGEGAASSTYQNLLSRPTVPSAFARHPHPVNPRTISLPWGSASTTTTTSTTGAADTGTGDGASVAAPSPSVASSSSAPPRSPFSAPLRDIFIRLRNAHRTTPPGGGYLAHSLHLHDEAQQELASAPPEAQRDIFHHHLGGMIRTYRNYARGIPQPLEPPISAPVPPVPRFPIHIPMAYHPMPSLGPPEREEPEPMESASDGEPMIDQEEPAEEEEW